MSGTATSEILAEFQKRPPVKTIKAANALGIKVFSSMSLPDDTSGMIKKDSKSQSGYSIYVNGNHSDTRKRFTIAHEIGHFLFHRNLIGDGIVEDAMLRATGLTNSIERQANAFAADFLMPWDLLDKESANGSRSIEELARLFQVSKDAMSYRLLGCAAPGNCPPAHLACMN